jgi:hypothetical protein
VTRGRRLLGVALAVVTIPVLLVAPGVASKRQFDQHPEDVTFARTIQYLKRLDPSLEFRIDAPVDLRFQAQGGQVQPVRCVRETGRLRAWVCVTMSSDGTRFIAAWIGREPTARPDHLVVTDSDPATRPNA